MKPALTLAVAALAAISIAAASNDPAEQLKSPREEARARGLFKEVRCLVCQNESIDDSEAELAGDLRKVVRQQVSEGRSNAEIKRYLTDRYGEFVLLRPSFSAGNAILWLTPFVLVLGGGAVLVLASRRRAIPSESPLSPEEEALLETAEVTEPSPSA